MASIVTSILSKSVGLLLNKARDKTVDKLIDGDITDAKIRELIVRELNDVKTQLDRLPRKDLLASYSFLLEGVNLLLKASVDKSEEKQKVVLNETHDDGGETSTKPSNTELGILTEALTLSQVMEKVKINSDREFEPAKERFKDARKEATKAYGVETLRIEDRIFAAKLRIVSELLECLESPDTAIINCLPFLEKLHSLPAIREMFSVYINRRYKLDGKAERVENVKAITLINYVLFQFVSEFSSEYCSAIAWPTIELADRSFHPILYWQEVCSRDRGEEFIQPPNKVFLEEEIQPYVSALNSHGEIIVRTMDQKNINVISRTGEVKMVKLNYPGDGEVIERRIIGLAVDSNDNVYVLVLTESGGGKSIVLYVFDENYNAKQNCSLPFLWHSRFPQLICYADIAINKNNDVIIIMIDHPDVYVCDNAGQLKHKYERNKRKLPVLSELATSDKNEILLASLDLNAVHRCTEKGDLESTIEIPEDHEVYSIAFHHVIGKIMVLTFNEKIDSYFVLCYSDTSELKENSQFIFMEDECSTPVVRSHPKGPAVFLAENSIIFI